MKRLEGSLCFHNNKAAVLIMALWLLLVMGIFAVGLARISYSYYRFAKFKSDKFSSLYAAQTITAAVKLRRIYDTTPLYDTLLELPKDEEYKIGNIKVVYSVIDEERKVNINRVPASKYLADLPGMDERKASAVIHSTERPFILKEQLLLLDEIKEEDYLELKDYITIYGEGRVNINTCSEETLEAMGMEKGLVKRIMEFREGEDEELGTDDDGIFESDDSISGTLKEETYLSLGEEQSLVSLASMNILGVGSNNYEIKAEVYVSNKLIDRYSIVIGKTKKNRYTVRRWERH